MRVLYIGSYVTHETNHFVYFYLDQKAVLLFKSGWVRVFVMMVRFMISTLYVLKLGIW